MKTSFCHVLVIVATLFCVKSIYANDALGVRALSMGQAFVGLASDNDAIFYNPAGLVVTKRFSPQVDWLFNIASKKHDVTFSLADSATSALAAEIAYNLNIDPTQDPKLLSHRVYLALACSAWEEHLSFGLTGKYIGLPEITKNTDPTMPDGESSAPRFSLDAGLLARAPLGFSLGLTGYNLIPTHSMRAPTSLGLGVAIALDDLFNNNTSGHNVDALRQTHGVFSGVTLALDWLFKDLTNLQGVKHELHTGGEWLIADVVPIRFGYSYLKNEERHLLHCGLGFVASVFGLNAYYQQEVTPNKTDNRSIGLSASVAL